MANTFKVTSADVGTSYAAALTAGGSETIIVIGMNVSNMHSSTDSWMSAKVVQSGGGSESILVHQMNVPINDSFNPVSGKLVLEAGDALHLDAENASSLEATISHMVIT